MFSEAKICEGDFSRSEMKDDVAELEIAMDHVSIVQILNDPGSNDNVLNHRRLEQGFFAFTKFISHPYQRIIRNQKSVYWRLLEGN